MDAIVCTKCGGNDMVERGDSYICKYCGTRYAKKTYVNNSMEAIAAKREAELLDYEIGVCEEYNRLSYAVTRHVQPFSIFDTIVGIIKWTLGIGIFIGNLSIFVWGIVFSPTRNHICMGIGFAMALWINLSRYFQTKQGLDEEEARIAENLPEFQRVTRLYNQITLIPKEFRSQDKELRKFYDEYGDRTQKKLIDRMLGHNKETQTKVVENY